MLLNDNHTTIEWLPEYEIYLIDDENGGIIEISKKVAEQMAAYILQLKQQNA